MSEIIKPNQPTIQLQLSVETAKALSSVLGEYALRITLPEFKEELTDEQKTQATKIFEERKKFATVVAQSLWKESNK